MPIRIADLFCGIGGVAEAISQGPGTTAKDHTTGRAPAQQVNQMDTSAVVMAIDIDQSVTSLYSQQHGVMPQCSTIESLEYVQLPDSADKIDMWWMSPPCQPYTSRGLQRGCNDSRSNALANLINLIPSERPRFIGFENVPAFRGSRHHRKLQQTLHENGYQTREYLICPTELGVPMRRKRFYLLARRDKGKLDDFARTCPMRSLANFVDTPSWDNAALHVTAELLGRYRPAMNIIDLQDTSAVTACFTSAYGKSPIRSGSYLHCQRRGIIRRFSANEIASLMGFRKDFFSSCDLELRSQYRLIGNSLSVDVVSALLSILLVV